MMKAKNILVLILLLVFTAITGCKKFLDINPKGLDIIRTTEQYNGLFNNAMLFSYSNFRTSSSGSTAILGSAEMPVFMSDDVVATLPRLNAIIESQQNAFKWQDDIYMPSEESNDWGVFYAQMYVYNKVIEGVMSSEGGTEQKKKELLAEGRANRAFNYLIFSNYFGQPYRASTAATDLCVPLVTDPDATASNFTRATVKEVYDFIINDLVLAIPDLQSNVYSRVRMSKPAAQYILGQTYFFMGDYSNALTYLSLAKNGLAGSATTIALYDYNTTMSTWVNPSTPHKGASGHPLQYNSTEVIFLKQLTYGIQNLNQSTLFIKPSVYALFSPADQRLKMFYNRDFSTGLNKLYYLNGPADSVFCYTRNSTGSVNWGPGLPNLYLMLAECKARTNDLNGAKAELETLRTKRMPAADAIVPITTQDAMVRFVLAERHREYACTGMRWFDMRRLWDDPIYNNTIDPLHRIDASSFILKRERLTLRIPPQIKAYSPGMPDNP